MKYIIQFGWYGEADDEEYVSGLGKSEYHAGLILTSSPNLTAALKFKTKKECEKFIQQVFPELSLEQYCEEYEVKILKYKDQLIKEIIE